MICKSHDNHVVALLKFEFVCFLGHVASVSHLILLVDFTCYLKISPANSGLFIIIIIIIYIDSR